MSFFFTYFKYVTLTFKKSEQIWRDKLGDWDQHIYTVVAKSFQFCPPPCDPIDSSPPGSPIPGILQARTLEWVAISFSDA